ncbi:response regulator receiver protein [Pseudomonas psychrotolerans L19]|uniref:response regulator n=1 Tax=Pseudomonas oryzihabitans TaxID=47885 RepID=UPI00023A3058|nr:response regulator [Pseudomonas psychrotolerans]EHK68697.1 response regulator receiver protein [Pseudomonas psychrotolerans L19]MBA1179069.1 response regulator [Pseudomonas psychrotolerans]MBA1211943.1 response regulator [Pseudomonas psychrotolerans]
MNNQLQILLVEDEPLVRELIKDVLSDLGNAVIECDRADAGLACLESNADNIALLVTDILTPGSLNGHQLALIASLRWPRLKVLITSGYADASTHQLPPNSTFIAKPWSYQQLEYAVRELMQ